MWNQTTHIRIRKDDHTRLMAIRAKSGNLASVIHKLLEEQVRNVADVETIMEGNVPVIISGRPLSGKTTLIREQLLPALEGSPVLLIDCYGEYTQLRNIGYDVYSLSFKDFREHVRFVPNTQSRVAETEIESIFSHLDMKRNELSKWVIIAEEAHTFKDVPTFVKFLYGSRHIVRKMIAITPKTDAFLGLVTLTTWRS